MPADGSTNRYAIISADTHAGADLKDYKPFLDREFHEEFDAWAANFTEGWSAFDVELEDAQAEDERDPAVRIGLSSFMSPYNWDSDKRLEHLEGEGIVAEVIFPNTVPPFYPSGVITAPAPTTKEEYRLRWAGVKAHNRWLAEFCAAVPGRRAGVAQIYLTDVDAAVSEARWAKEHGLAGVVIPADHHRKLVNIYERRLDPFWQACSELELPVHRHTVAVSDPESEDSGPAGPALGVFEAMPFVQRTLGQLMIGGVLHRHPKLKFVFTETTASWVVPALATLDGYYAEARTKGTLSYPFGHRAIGDHDMLPSEYFARNCFLGGFLITPDIDTRHAVGTDKIMWGADYPHHEGTWPHTDIALRVNFSGVPEPEVRQMLAGNACQVYGFDMTYLQSLADKFGPTPEQLAEPVSPDEIPSNHACPTFQFAAGIFH